MKHWVLRKNFSKIFYWYKYIWSCIKNLGFCCGRNLYESYKCTSTTNYITEIRLRATNVPLYNQLHHRNQSESYTCTSVQLTTSQKLVWELQMYFCTTNYVTEISLEGYTCTSVQPTTSQKLVWDLQMYLCTTNYITEISLRATHVLLYNQLHHRN